MLNRCSIAPCAESQGITRSLFGTSLILASHSTPHVNEIAVVAGGHRARKFRGACGRSGTDLFHRSGCTRLFSDLKVGRDAATGLADHYGGHRLHCRSAADRDDCDNRSEWLVILLGLTILHSILFGLRTAVPASIPGQI